MYVFFDISLHSHTVFQKGLHYYVPSQKQKLFQATADNVEIVITAIHIDRRRHDSKKREFSYDFE